MTFWCQKQVKDKKDIFFCLFVFFVFMLIFEKKTSSMKLESVVSFGDRYRLTIKKRIMFISKELIENYRFLSSKWVKRKVFEWKKIKYEVIYEVLLHIMLLIVYIHVIDT